MNRDYCVVCDSRLNAREKRQERVIQINRKGFGIICDKCFTQILKESIKNGEVE